MIKVQKFSERDLYSIIGNPADPEFEEKIKSELIRFKTPFPLNCNDKEINHITCHPLIAPALEDALLEILKYYSYEKIKEFGLDLYHGCFNIRPVSGYPGYWSIHSFACAVDFNAHIGKMTIPSVMPYPFVDAFKKRGFYWGGEWRRPDGMHFSLVKA